MKKTKLFKRKKIFFLNKKKPKLFAPSREHGKFEIKVCVNVLTQTLNIRFDFRFRKSERKSPP